MRQELNHKLEEHNWVSEFGAGIRAVWDGVKDFFQNDNSYLVGENEGKTFCEGDKEGLRLNFRPGEIKK